MRSTMYGSTAANNPFNIISKHLENLREIIAGLSERKITDKMRIMPFHTYFPASASLEFYTYSDADIKKVCDSLTAAMEGMTKIINANNEFSTPINAENVEALLNIPAIRKDWPEIMKYRPLELMSQPRQKVVRQSVGELAQDRNAKIKELQKEIDELNAEVDAINKLDRAITKRSRPVPELNRIQNLKEGISSGRYSCESNCRDFDKICEMIARSDDPELTFQQAFEGKSFWYLPTCLSKPDYSKQDFNEYFAQYGYKPENTFRPQ